MYMRVFRFGFVACALTLGSCGGGGSESTNPIAVVPGPVATPSPAPSPAPSPTFNYTSFDLSQDRVFAGQVATGITIERYTSNTAPFYSIEAQDALLQTNRGALELSFGASKSLVTRLGGEAVSFGPADVQFSNSDGITWRRTRDATRRGEAMTFSRYPNAQYIYNAVQEISEDVTEPNKPSAIRDTKQYFLVGERTREGDAPTTSVTNYTVMLDTTLVGRNRGGGFTVSGGMLTVDQSSGTVSAKLSATQASYPSGATPESATLVFNGTVSSSGIAGSISSPDGSYTGAFNGDLFGPGASEAGLVFTLRRPDGVRAAGRLIGRRL